MQNAQVEAGDHQQEMTLYVLHARNSAKPPEQQQWCVAVGAVFDYVAVQSRAVMLLSHLDRISLGGNTCTCVCGVQSRHGNLDFIKEKGASESGVWNKCRAAFVVCSCSFSPCPRVCWCIPLLYVLLLYLCECVNDETLMSLCGRLWWSCLFHELAL